MTAVVAIESATDAAGVALADEAGLLASVVVGRGRRHAETIAPAVEEVCRAGGVALPELRAVAVDVGPGLFTGLRVGIATAQGLGFALGVPLVPVSSLDVLAAAALTLPAPPRPVAAVVDARRGELFWAWYSPGPAGRLPAEPGAGGHPVAPAGTVPPCTAEARVAPPEVLAGEVARAAAEGPAPLLLGDGARRYLDVLVAAGAEVAGPPFDNPPVAVLAAIGVARAAAGDTVAPGAVTARYLREADARINWERR